MIDLLSDIIKSHKEGQLLGIYSVCSANQNVIEASMELAKSNKTPLLIESTSNQVNQYGGYTGKNPEQFSQFVRNLARKMKFTDENLILGGDHLGPNPWQNEKSDSAMKKASDLIRESIKAGYRKIHLDTSMKCLDDPGEKNKPLDAAMVAERAAELCETAERTVQENSGPKNLPRYIIGTDVPVPGGASDKLQEIHITPVNEVQNTIRLTREKFLERDLESAWQRVIAVVVQPGVEFDDSAVFGYNRERAAPLASYIDNVENLVYEAHSTDYQKNTDLKDMVEDHFVILKVGPELTFSFREAVFSLAFIEREIAEYKKHMTLSDIIEVIDRVMTEEPEYWQKYYQGNNKSRKFARKYSFSDRIRYYWPHREIDSALQKLIANLTQNDIPLTLLSQYMPNQYQAVRNGEIPNRPEHLIRHHIKEILKKYALATGVNKFNSN